MMKKTQIEEQVKNIFESFFGSENTAENVSLETRKRSEVLYFDDDKISAGDYKTLTKILKQVFTFFPGAVVLFGLSMMLVYISIIQPYQTVWIDKPIELFLTFAVAFLMTWFGSGNIKKSKHMAIPLSVVGIGALIGAISGIVSIIDLGLLHKIFSDSGYPLYFLPLGLIAPLVKNVD